eukprot:274533-Amphidinium_carterae.3
MRSVPGRTRLYFGNFALLTSFRTETHKIAEQYQSPKSHDRYAFRTQDPIHPFVDPWRPIRLRTQKAKTDEKTGRYRQRATAHPPK